MFVLAIGMGFRTYASAAATGTVTASTLFMRTGPSTEYPKVQVNGKTVFLSRGDSVAISHGSNGWYYVTASFEGTKVKGYVSAAHIITNGVVPTAAPSATPTNTPTPKPTSKPSSSTSSTTSNEVVTSGFPRKGTITAGTLNVRNNAGTSGTTIVGKLSKGASVELLDAKKVNSTYWYKISYTEGGVTKTGYVSSQYVKPAAAATATQAPTKAPTKAPETTNPSGSVLTEGFPRTGTITAEGLNIRSGAGKEHSVVTSLVKGDAVVVENAKKDSEGTYWYKISFYQNGALKEGYASSKYVKVAAPTATPSPTATPTPAIDSTENVVKGTFPRTGEVTASSLRVRKGAGTSYDEVAALVKTTKVNVLAAKKASNGDYWYQISFTRDGVKQTGYAHSKYIAVSAVVATATPTKAPAASSTPVPTNTPTIAPTPATVTAEITREEIKDDMAFFYYQAKTAKDGVALMEDMDATSKKLVTIAKDTPVMVINQNIDGETIWYRIAVKSSNNVICGYVTSDMINLVASRENAVAAQLTEDKVRLRNNAASNGSYVKTAENKILTLSLGDSVWIIAEEGEWFKIVVESDGIVYEGYVQEGPVYLMESFGSVPATPTPTPTSTPTPTPTVTPRPVTSTPTVTPGVTNTPRPTATSTPTPTPEPLPVLLPTPIVVQMEEGNYPINRSGTVTGYGYLHNDYGKTMVAYVVPMLPFDIVCDENGNFIIFDEEDTVILYDQYINDRGNLYRHIGFEQDGKMYYGYVNNAWVVMTDEKFLKPATGTATPSPTAKPGETVYPSGDTEPGTTLIPVDFETYLDQQGFPESYKPYLRALHMQYPNWIFEAYQTGLDWNTVIDEESISGKNLLPNSKHIGWKSLETGAYDWTKDKFIVYDGSTWVTASRDAIEYYMDPRNFLNESNVFMFEVLRYAPDYQDEEGVESILYNTPFYRTYYTYTDDYGNSVRLSYAQTFIAAAEYSGVSPYHLASRVKQEVVTSATTASDSVSGKVSGYTGLYNFYNIGAYHSTQAGGAIKNGLKYAKNGASNNDELNDASLIPWTNPYNAIVGGAYILGANYINKGQDTIYLQKFNVTDTSTYYHQYMANVEAPYSESKKTAGAYEDVGSLPIVFSIPVYENMPKEPEAVPENTLNPNNWLKSLEVFDENGNNLQLTPTFNMKTDQAYYLVVSSADLIVQVEAKAVSTKTKVLGTGFHGLNFGTNTLSITAKAENGDIREYLIVIIRQE